MLSDPFRDNDTGNGIRLLDGSFLNLKRLQVKIKGETDIIRDFMLSTDSALNAASEADMQHIVDKCTCNNFSVANNITKIKVMHQTALSKPYIKLNICIINKSWL